MNRKNYIRIIDAIIKLLVVVMVEAGKVSIKNAQFIGTNIYKAVVGHPPEDTDKKD